MVNAIRMSTHEIEATLEAMGLGHTGITGAASLYGYNPTAYVSPDDNKLARANEFLTEQGFIPDLDHTRIVPPTLYSVIYARRAETPGMESFELRYVSTGMALLEINLISVNECDEIERFGTDRPVFFVESDAADEAYMSFSLTHRNRRWYWLPHFAA